MRFLEILFDKRIWTGATFSLALAVPAIGQEGIKVLSNSADPVGKDQINLSDGRVYFAKITCSNTNLTLNQIKPDARDWMGNFDFNLKTYVQLVGLNGILPVQKNAANAVSVELKDAEGNPLTQVTVEGVQFKPMIAPVMVRTKTNSALSFTNAQSIMCDNPAFYFRYSNETPALVVWAELVSNKNRFKILQDILSPAAIAIDSVLHAVLDKTVPGLQSTTKIATFSTALGSLISAFDKKEMRTNSVLLRHGDNFVNMSGLDLNVRIMDPDRGLDGREFGPADRSFLTGQVPFPTSWGDFLGGVEQEKLRKAADHKDSVGECVAIRNALYSPDPTKRTLSDIDTAFAILASFRGSRVTANNAYACLDQELACASRDFTNPANARKTGVWGIVSSRIETKYFFEQTIEGFDEICEEYDKTRESDAAGEEGSRIKERKAAEAAAKVLRAKRAALYSSAEAHSAKGATFFVRGSDNKSGLEKFTS